MTISTEFLHQLDKFSIILNKRVTSNFIGERKSKLTGRGLLFSDHGRYTFGDDFRTIDWKIYGRTENLYIKRYEEDRNLTVNVIIDFSASMNFGEKIKKYEFASMISLGFCHVALKNNEKFVLSTFSEKLARFKPKRGVKQLAAVVQYLNSKVPKGKTNFEESLSKHKELIKDYSLIVIISDFFYDLEEIKTILLKFKKNKIKLIQVIDKQEKNFDLDGNYELIDLETEESMKTYIDPLLKKKYFNQLEYHNNQIKKYCDSTGAEFYSVHSGEDIFEVFYKILR
ncbi:DUF58 domain-containing protein [Candidatus Woesearchaeota archaeon]|nr:DUF58 domain-containing protein [Candidatus Woesearchaeota archaeon]